MNLLEKQLKAGLVYSKTNIFKKKLRITTLSLERFFTLVEKPYLALSFGKQSIVLAHIIHCIRPETPMLLLQSWETFIMHNMEEIIKKFLCRFPVKLHVLTRDNVSWNDWDWQRTRDHGEKDLQNLGNDVIPDWDGVIMGLSKDESVARRITLSIGNTDWATIFRYKNGKYRCTPIQFWNINDLAAYIAMNNLPLLDAYRQGGLETRTTARITRNNAEMNGLIDLKNRNISAYNTIVKRFPELSAKG
jgi:3'-phosphoadenosine 5'-phosphosulfate sulfotransferase (PAPS reductase)/FAD synthetase